MPRKRNALTEDQQRVVDELRKLGGTAVYWELEGVCRAMGPMAKVSITSAVVKGAIIYVERTPTAPAKYKLPTKASNG